MQKVTPDPGSTGQPASGKYYKMFTTYNKNVLSTKIEQILQDVDHVKSKLLNTCPKYPGSSFFQNPSKYHTSWSMRRSGARHEEDTGVVYR